MHNVLWINISWQFSSDLPETCITNKALVLFIDKFEATFSKSGSPLNIQTKDALALFTFLSFYEMKKLVCSLLYLFNSSAIYNSASKFHICVRKRTKASERDLLKMHSSL